MLYLANSTQQFHTLPPMKHRTLFSFLLLLNLSVQAQTELDSLLVELENAMEHRASYDQKKEAHLRDLRSLLHESKLSAAQQYDINKQIINEFEVYTFDSALFYLQLNLELAHQLKRADLIHESSLHLAGLLASSGRYKEAIDILDSIRHDALPTEMWIDYYTHYRKVYAELSFYTRAEQNRPYYLRMLQAYTDSLLSLLPPQSDQALALRESAALDSRNLEQARQLNSQRLAVSQIATRLYSMVTFSRSQSYELEGDVQMQEKYLILSAISDIRASVKDNASLTVLAMLLFKQKQLDRAHRYIKFSVEDAVFYNSRLRFVEISNIFPMITDAYQHKTDEQRRKLRNSLVAISVLSLVLVAAIVLVYRQVKKRAEAQFQLQEANGSLQALNQNLQRVNRDLQALNLQLAEANHIKEHYIGHFLSICSNYIDKLDQYRHNVHKQIAARKVQALFDATKSPDFLDNELKEFYDTFDSTFLHIYPNFVDEINALLLPEEQIVLRSGELLNTELRIFALIRLGIDDSSRIAKLLRYSVNTIYNYRAKMKNKAAVARADFEDLVKRIGAPDEDKPE